MRIALIGNHPEGVALAAALRSEAGGVVAAVVDGEIGGVFPGAEILTDIDELCARTDLDLVIVAGPLQRRGLQLRRVLQSRFHALCVTTAADTPDLAYEASLILHETGKMALPIVPSLVHPAVHEMQDWLQKLRTQDNSGRITTRILTWHQAGVEQGGERPEPDWHLIRTLGGDLIELVGFAPHDGAEPMEPVVFSGRFQDGSLLHGLINPTGHSQRWSLSISESGQTARLRGASKTDMQFEWEEGPTDSRNANKMDPEVLWHRYALEISEALRTAKRWRITWQDEIRVCEWADALRRSVAKQKISTLDYQDTSEEVGAKGTLTLIGCGMVWIILLLALIAIWQPLVLWGVVPLLVLFLALAVVNWLAQKR